MSEEEVLEKEREGIDEEILRLTQKRQEIDKRLKGDTDAKDPNEIIDKLHLVREITSSPIPSILTVSFKEVVEFYQEKIVRVRAGGGEYKTNKVTLDKDCGIVYATGSSSIIEVNYKQSRASDGTILNPLDQDKIQEIFEHLDNNLPEYKDTGDRKYPPDIPIEKLIVEIEDDKIAELTETKTSSFDLTFISERVEPSIRERVHNLNKGLGVFLQGFEIRNLNVVELMDRTQIYGEGSKKNWKPIIHFLGYARQDLEPKSPIEIAGKIYSQYLPPKYAMLKTYRILKGNQLALDGFETR